MLRRSQLGLFSSSCLPQHIPKHIENCQLEDGRGKACQASCKVTTRIDRFHVGVTQTRFCSALGGILGNLKSGKGLFGTEATTSFSKVVLTTVEQQITEVGQEMRSADSAQSLKKSDNAMTAKAVPVSKPQYTADDRWDVSLVSAGRETIEITVRPTQPAKLLIKAWAKENGVNPDEWDIVVPAGVSWTAGIVDPEGLIGESGILPAVTVRLVKREY